MTKTCICGSVVVFKGRKAFLLHHKKFGLWLYCGGHREEYETPYETAMREAKEEAGMKVKILNPDQKEGRLMKDNGASQLPRPFTILHQHVKYKEGRHEHFDMVYLAKLVSMRKSRDTEPHETRWITESEIDGLETFDNVKWSLHKAFSIMKENNYFVGK